MNKLICSIIALFFSIGVMAQNEEDALRYSNLNTLGTARFVSLGGAMGALGGDVSAMGVNPAGIGVYRSNTMVFTPTWTTTNIESEYYNSAVNSRVNNNIHLSNMGFVSTYELDEDENFKFLNFGFSYNQLANFNKDIYIAGENYHSSFLDPETEYLNNFGEESTIFEDAQLIFYDNGNYVSDYTTAEYGSLQTQYIQTSGYAGEYNFNVAVNILNKIYAGLSIGLLHVKYKEQQYYTETPFNVPNLLYFDTQNEFTTRGNGINLKVGVIGRINEWLRLGGSLHTPTIFNLQDVYSSDVNGTFDFGQGDGEESFYAQSGLANFKYELSTPFKAIVGAAFIYKKYGFVSVDYEYIDYTSLSLQAFDYSFISENNQISSLYKPTSNIRVGAEYTVGPLAARAGFALLGSPFSDVYRNKIASTYIYSGGLGFRSNEFFVDFAVKYSLRNQYFNLYDSPNDAYAQLGYNQISYLLSLGFKF